ncbi:hypothetical protein NST74_23760 [Paenibacillus sp. FSL F4-0125]|uniref:hypothetical protein n=1 Tax=Paenibacillus sp. FSL F4-0125 TaxID=2954730 RepID=UPI0030F7991B
MRTWEEKPGWFAGAKASIEIASQSARKGCIPLGASNSLPSGGLFLRTWEEKPGWFAGAKASIGSASQSARKGCIPLGASNSLSSGGLFLRTEHPASKKTKL